MHLLFKGLKSHSLTSLSSENASVNASEARRRDKKIIGGAQWKAELPMGPCVSSCLVIFLGKSMFTDEVPIYGYIIFDS